MPSSGDAGGKPEIKIDGAKLTDAVKNRIAVVMVDDHLHLPDQLMLVIRDGDKSTIGDTRVRIGSEVELEGTAVAEDGKVNSAVLFQGEVTSLEADFLNTVDPHLVIRAHDVSHRMHRGRRTAAFKNMTDGDIARRLAGECGVATGQIDAGTLHEHVSQVNLTDWEFLKARAREIGFEAGVEGKRLFFRRPIPPDGSVTLKWNGDLLEFHPRVSAVAQVKTVKARGWNYKRKDKVVGQVVTSSDPSTPSLKEGSLTPNRLGGVFTTPDFVVTERVLSTQAEADIAAQGMAGQIMSAMAEADGMARGNPKIQAGKAVEIDGLQRHFEGKWIVTSSRHLWSDEKEGYRTYFTVSGRQERSLLGLASLGATSGMPSAGGPPIYGVVQAIVTNVSDPENLFRIKVRFPWLDDLYESDWVRVAQFASGKDYGAFFLPEVNDEVLVAFEQGDIRRPYVIGALYNGKDKPNPGQPVIAKGGQIVRRGVRTRTGHRLEFSDEAGKVQVELETATGKVKFTLDDTQSKLTITCQGDIEIESKTGNITMKALKNVNIESSTGTAGMKALAGASLEATGGNTTVKGLIVNIN